MYAHPNELDHTICNQKHLQVKGRQLPCSVCRTVHHMTSKSNFNLRTYGRPAIDLTQGAHTLSDLIKVGKWRHGRHTDDLRYDNSNSQDSCV